MYPRLISLPFYTLHTFGLLLAAAYLTALWWLVKTGRREGFHPDMLTSLGFWAIVGAIVGAKGLMVLRTLPDYLAHPSELFSAVVPDERRRFLWWLHWRRCRVNPVLPEEPVAVVLAARGSLRPGDRAWAGDRSHRLPDGRG